MQVFFFGGYCSTHNDVVAWKHSFEKKVSNVKAMVFHYPSSASAGNPLERWDASEYVADLVKDGDIIIGHSSGCAISNDVAEAALKLNKKFKLIALDGFCPSEELLALPDTKVWSARNDNDYSLNYHVLQKRAGDKFHVYITNKVKERWPLHFSLLNLNVSDSYAGISQGYHNVDANLEVAGMV